MCNEVLEKEDGETVFAYHCDVASSEYMKSSHMKSNGAILPSKMREQTI